MMSSKKIEPDTPYGSNAMYTVHFHVVGEVVDDLGSARPHREVVERRVVTPFGELKAVAIAASALAASQSELIYHEVGVASVEHEFDAETADHRDPESYSR